MPIVSVNGWENQRDNLGFCLIRFVSSGVFLIVRFYFFKEKVEIIFEKIFLVTAYECISLCCL